MRAFFQDMRMRGLGDPSLVVSDGAPGVIRAIEECFPRSARQRCLAHRMRNLAVKFQPICGPSSTRGWRPAIRCRHERSRAISPTASVPNTQPRRQPPSPASKTTSKSCIAHLRLPVTHRRTTRTTNLLERLFVEERRMKIIPNGFGGKLILKLDGSINELFSA